MTTLEMIRTLLENRTTGPIFTIGALVLFAGIIWIIHILSSNSRRSKEASFNASLKAQMIERGMSPEEIERVIRAGSVREVVEPNLSAEAKIVRCLGNHCYDSGDISTIVEIVRRHDTKPDAELLKIQDYAMVKSMAGQWMDAKDMARILREGGRTAPQSSDAHSTS